MNELHIGFEKNIEFPKSGFLLIHDELPDIPRARIFDPIHHSLNPLRDISYKAARDLADVLYTTTPQGENTLTVRNGKRALLQAFLVARSFDKIHGDEEVTSMIGDLLTSPVLNSVLCNPKHLHNVFSFNPRSIIIARINRAELGDFDALVLGLILMGHFRGQIVVPDFGFYARDAHIALIRQNRLTAGINHLAELPPKLRHSVLLIKDKNPATTTYDDAETLARYAGLEPKTNGYNEYVARAIA